MDSTASGLFIVNERLERARERSRHLIVVQGAALGVGAGLAAFSVAELVRKFSTPDAIPATVPIEIGCAALAVATIVTAVVALSRTPSVLDLARRADLRFGLDERISTALEVSGRPTASVVSAALLRDAKDRANAVDAAVLVPLRLSRLTWLLPLAAAATLAVMSLPEPVANSPLATEATPAPLSQAERNDLAADIERVARVVQEQAETRKDAYLGAIGRTLQTLSERTASGEFETRAELAGELAVLETHAQSAVARARDPNAQRIPALLEALQDRVQPKAVGPEEGAPTSSDRQMDRGQLDRADEPLAETQQSEQAQASAGGPTTNDDRSGEAPTDLDQMIDAAQSGRPEQDNLPRQSQPASGNYYEIAKQQAAEAARLRSMQPPSPDAQLVGGAEESGQGESSLAGKGTDELRGAETDLSELQFETSSDMRLEALDNAEGRRIQMKTTPEAQFSAVASAALDGSAWVALPEATVSRHSRGAASRAAVANYLSATTGQTD